MPSGAKKRKAAKRKQVSLTNPQHGENDSQVSNKTLDPLVEVVEKIENTSSENKSTKDGNSETEIGSKSKNSSSSSSDSSDEDDKVVEKKVVVESTPVIETISPVDPFVEEVAKVCDETESKEKKDLVVEEEAANGSEICLKEDLPTSSVVEGSVLKENEDEKLRFLEEKDSSEPTEEYAAASVPVEGSVSEVSGADCVDETETVEYSDRQAPPAASIPLAVQKTTSWKSCCGIFELFSGSRK